MGHIYLDYNASTPIDPAVAAAMRPYLEAAYGNPSSGHRAASPAKAALEAARGQVAALLGCAPDEVVFTSGGSEANNLALKGVFFGRREQGQHIVTTRVEHPAILAPCRFLERLGARVTYLPVDGTGRIDPDDLRAAITSATILVSIMDANNEVGTIQPIEACGRIAHESGVLFHTDAAQSVGKIPTRVDELGIDLLSVAGHKVFKSSAWGQSKRKYCHGWASRWPGRSSSCMRITATGSPRGRCWHASTAVSRKPESRRREPRLRKPNQRSVRPTPPSSARRRT